MRKNYLLLFSLLLAGFISEAQIAQPDSTFGTNGAVISDLNNNNDVAFDMLQQPDGKFVVAGYGIIQSHKLFMVMRLNEDGTPDSTFSSDGKSIVTVSAFNNYAKAISRQSDGKLLIAGYYDNNFYNDPAVVRLNEDGSQDSTFGLNGMAKFVLSTSYDEFQDMAIQPDGKIVVAGRTYVNNNYDFLLMRLNADGSPDSTFNNDGIVNTDFNNSDDCIYSLTIMPDGKFLVSGTTQLGSSYFAAARYNADGTPDLTFGTGGKMSIGTGNRFDKCYGMAIQEDSSIVLAGRYHNGPVDNYMVARITYGGVLDNTFGTGGVKLFPTTDADDLFNDVIIQPDGMILLAGKGAGQDAMMMRLTSTGDPDITFGQQGIYSGNMGGVKSELTCLMLLPDYSVIACGFTNQGTHDDFLIVKALSSTATSIADEEHTATMQLYPNPATDHIKVQSSIELDDNTNINLYDGAGRRITGLNTSFTENEIDISLPVLSAGIYMLQVINDGRQSVQKFFIK